MHFTHLIDHKIQPIRELNSAPREEVKVLKFNLWPQQNVVSRRSLLLPCPVVEEVAGFDVPVDDVVGVDVPQCQEQCPHVITSLRERHVGEVVLGIQM